MASAVVFYCPGCCSLAHPFTATKLLQVSIVAFKKGKLEVLAHAWDRNLGGRDFDEVLFDYFVKEFGDKYKIDIRSNPRASFRLRMACEKVRGSRQGW